MKSVSIVVASLLFCASGAASAAFAANGVTSDAADMYAGPSDEYPQVMHLGAGRPVTIYGCTARYSWCDVEWRGNRGWVSAATLEMPYGQARVPVGEAGPRIGLPEVRFNMQPYWEENYRKRPWYADRARWYSDNRYERARAQSAAADAAEEEVSQQQAAATHN